MEDTMFKRKFEFTVIIEQDEDGIYIGRVPTLKSCHTQAKSIDTLIERIKEAILLCLDVEKPPPKERFIGIQEVEVTK